MGMWGNGQRFCMGIGGRVGVGEWKWAKKCGRKIFAVLGGKGTVRGKLVIQKEKRKNKLKGS